MRVSALLLLTLVVLIPTAGFALTIAPDDLYADVRPGSKEVAGINLLTREGIVHGYGNGFFGTARLMNRAEFLTMTLRFQPNLLGPWTDAMVRDCFPDVHASDWFSRAVCYSKDIGLIAGYSDGLFHPERPVTYGEALKILTFFFNYDVLAPSGGHWAEPLYRSAAARGTDLPVTITLDTSLTRGQIARLAAAFLAESKGQLVEFRRAENGNYGGSTSSSTSRSISSSSSSRSSSQSSSFSSSVSTRPLDPLPDTSILSQFLLLGETGPIVASANIFIEAEPLDVTKIAVNVNTDTPTIRAFMVYDENRRELGRATLDTRNGTNRYYSLSITPGTLTLERRTNLAVYVRPVLLLKDLGGNSNEIVEVGNIVVEGNGVWSSQKYTKASVQAFPAFVTSRSTITTITNAIETTAPMILGANQRIGSFRFSGRRSDSLAETRITHLRFTVGSTGGAGVSNVKLRADGTSETHSCTYASSTSVITCASIPEIFGTLDLGPRTLSLTADVSIGDPVRATLQVSLNDAGSLTDAGSITWTDGTSTFEWLGLESPLVRGTFYKY